MQMITLHLFLRNICLPTLCMYSAYLHYVCIQAIYTMYVFRLSTLCMYSGYLHYVCIQAIYTMYVFRLSTLCMYSGYLHYVCIQAIYIVYVFRLSTLCIIQAIHAHHTSVKLGVCAKFYFLPFFGFAVY